MIYGYSRCSKEEQIYSIQAQAVSIQDKKVVDALFYDFGISGSVPLANRPAGKQLLSILKPGDSLVISKLDRGFRDAADAMTMFKQWKGQGISLYLLDISSDDLCNSIVGELVMTIMAGVATFERNRISERTKEGLARAKAKGVKLGCHNPENRKFNDSLRQSAVDWSEQYRELIEEYQAQGHNQTTIARLMNLSRIPTRNGGTWTQPHVSRLIKRLDYSTEVSP